MPQASSKQIPISHISPINPIYIVGPFLILIVILVGTLLVPSMATCSPNWDAPFRTFGLDKRITILG